MKIIEQLRKVKDFESEKFSAANALFKEILSDVFLNKLSLDTSKYKLKSSLGTGQFADMWWIGIFDKNYYFNVLNVESSLQIGASKGYYVVYLFNKEKSKIYLTLAQASSGITSNKEGLRIMQEKNDFFQTQIFKNTNYLYSIYGKLSNTKIQMARDYENAIILAKEYDLSTEISDDIFTDDLKDMLCKYEELIRFISSNSMFLTPNFFISNRDNKVLVRKPEIFDFDEYMNNEKEQFLIQHESPYNFDILTSINDRTPRLISVEKEEYYRDYRLSKTILLKNNFKCCVDSDHRTFITSDNHLYAEAHHLVPMKFQKDFQLINLDRIENIFSLCPICHNAIHYGNEIEKIKRIEILFKISSDNSDFLRIIGINNHFDLYDKFYGN